MGKIKSYDFLNKIYPFVSGQQNQGVFVINITNAAGSKYLTLPANKTKRTTAYLETERSYAKQTPLPAAYKASFPDSIPIRDIDSFLKNIFRKEKIRECMDRFGIPGASEENLDYLVHALSMQFAAFIQSDGDEADNIILTEYQRQLNGEPENIFILQPTMYKNDDFWEEGKEREMNVGCYENVTHTWIIHNSGKCNWVGRKLVLVGSEDLEIDIKENEVTIPDTNPNEIVKVFVEIDSRGMEGSHECKWEMHDSAGNNCFPNHRWELNFKVVVTFRS